jgi:hypothetical protein
MPRYGINIGINLSKIEKDRVTTDKNGNKWMNLTTWVDTDVKDQYGNNGFISQSTTKEERDNGVQTTILGNSEVFFPRDESSSRSRPVAQDDGKDIDDLPF